MIKQVGNLYLFSSIAVLKGIGSKTAENFSNLGINTIYDLIYYFPFRYDDLESLPLDQLEDGQKTLLKGEVVTEPFISHFGYRKSRLSFKLKIDHDIIMVNFFNQPWLKDKVEIGKNVAVYGTYNLNRQSLSAFKFIAGEKENSELTPIYSVSKKVKQKKLQELIKQVLSTEFLEEIPNSVPSYLRRKYRLLSENNIITGMHFPKKKSEASLAKRSAVFREFFLFELQIMQMTNQNIDKKTGFSKKYSVTDVKNLINSLSFELSNDQKTVVNEIFKDLKSENQMRRLLQGDVGSGKTIVAVLAIFANVISGFQSALMVPTEILAEQHFAKIDSLLQGFGIRVALLTGDTKEIEKKEIYRELKDGTINVVIGTHALIQDSVTFSKLGLAIIDEQHRFGVNQRNKFINKGNSPDILYMTATPIPRTLALTIYGDMSVSEIRSLPAGRKPIISTWVGSNKLANVLLKMQNQLDQGFQIYAVTPLISNSEKSDLKNAEELQAKLANYFKKQKVVLLHGKLSSDKKNEIMEDFTAGKINILVTTSVIEVGVDVANANMMIIFNAERFGLSQLHQLRGRIGRGTTESYCFFVSDANSEVAKKRMNIITNNSDGFKLAEEDLKLRGEGDVFGKIQSGLPQFQVGDVISDFKTLAVARDEAKKIITDNPTLEGNDFSFLRDVLEYKKDLDIL